MRKLKLFTLFAAMLFATSMWAADPTGCVDAWQGNDGSIYIKGWAFDSENTNATLAIHVYMYKAGVADPLWSEGNTVANSSRPDVNNVHHCGNNHGFERYISTANLSPGTYWINIWALHAAGTSGTNVRLHAATNENQYDFTLTVKSPLTISYDANGGSNAPSSQQKCYGININLQGKGSLARSGYTTDGWATSATGNKAYNFGASYSGNASTKLYAHWTANKYTVTLDQQGGSGGSSSVQATYNANMPSMTKPTRTGYTFQGYYDATSGGTQYYKADGSSARTWNKTSNATLYARWTANTYTITLDPQGGAGGDASKTATFGQATPTVNIPGRTGYSFGGYYTGTNGSGTQYLKPDANNTATSVRNWDIASNTTLYAKWNARTYTVTFDQQGGNGGTASTTATFDAAMPAATMPTRDGYTFKGYYDAATEGTLYYNADGSSARAWNKTAAATLYARWEIINYTVAYNLDGGEVAVANPTEYTVETETFTLNNPTKEDYIFLGWTGSNGETPQEFVTIAKGSTGDKNYVANWKLDPEVAKLEILTELYDALGTDVWTGYGVNTGVISYSRGTEPQSFHASFMGGTYAFDLPFAAFTAASKADQGNGEYLYTLTCNLPAQTGMGQETLTVLVKNGTIEGIHSDNADIDMSKEEEISGWAALQNAINAGGVIKLAANVNANGEAALVVPAGKTVVLDLNDHIIDRGLANAEANGSVIVNNGTLAIMDGGVITGGKTTGNGGGILNNGILTLYNSAIAGNAAAIGGGVYSTGEAQFWMTAGLIMQNEASSYPAIGGDVTFNAQAVIQINEAGDKISIEEAIDALASLTYIHPVLPDYEDYQPTDPEHPTDIDNTAVSEKVTKRLVNGQILIEKDGVLYNVLGTRVK